MAYIVMAYTAMEGLPIAEVQYSYGLFSYGLYSYGLYSYGGPPYRRSTV